MKDYQLGECCELEVVGMRPNGIGQERLYVRDEDREYPIKNLLKCQYTSIPETMYVVVSMIDQFGHVCFKQDIKRVIEEHYTGRDFGAFNVTDIKTDNNGYSYYLIEDDFAEHRYYFRGEPKYQIGGICVLDIVGVNEEGFLQFREHEYTPEPVPAPTQTNKVIRSTNTVPYGDESTTLEYKTSMVFNPNTSQPDITYQTTNIVIGLAALMNTEGGKLIIGVRDDKVIVGIENDYEHLNDDDQDTFNYRANRDGFELKLRHVLNYLCPTLAGSLVEFQFKSKNNHEYVVIDVKRADRPIWVRAQAGQGSVMYIRQGNRRKTIYGEELTNFIFRRMKESVESMVGGAQSVAQLDTEKLEEILRRIINLNKHQDVQLPPPPQRTIDYWVVWDEDGRWWRQREPADACFKQVPFYTGLSNPRLVFCYGNNKVVTMDWKKVRSGVNLNKVRASLWNTNTPTHIFIADTNDLLCIKSHDCHGTESIKLHALTDFSPVENGGAQGASILPENTEVLSYAMVDAEHLHAVNGLRCKKADRSRSCGVPVTTEAAELSKQIAYIEQLLKQE